MIVDEPDPCSCGGKVSVNGICQRCRMHTSQAKDFNRWSRAVDKMEHDERMTYWRKVPQRYFATDMSGMVYSAN